MTLAETIEWVRAQSRAACDAAMRRAEQLTADMPEEERDAILADTRAMLDEQLAALEREWAAFAHLYATGQLPEGTEWRSLIDLAAQPHAPGEPLQ